MAYEAAKRIALGLEQEAKQQTGDDLWNLEVNQGGILGELPFQYFEKTFEMPPEQEAERVALSLYGDEYEKDRKRALESFTKLVELLRRNDFAGLEAFVKDNGLTDWLSFIFIEEAQVKEKLVSAVKSAGAQCREALGNAAETAASKLVRFDNLMKDIVKLCREK